MQQESNKYDDFADKKIQQLKDKEKMQEIRTEPRSKIEEIMWKKNVTFNELMRLTGLQHSQIASMVTGKQKSYHFETLKIVCKALKTSPNEIYGFK